MRWLAKLFPTIKGKFFTFFIFTLLLSTIYPLFLSSKIGMFVLHILISLLLIAGIQLVSYNHKIFMAGLILGVLCLVLTWGSLFFPQVFIIVNWGLVRGWMETSAVYA